MQEISETYQAQEGHYRHFHGNSRMLKPNDSHAESVQSRPVPDVPLRGFQAMLVRNLHRLCALPSTIADLL